MTLTLITAPAQQPVTLAEAKAHLHFDSAIEDTRISDLIETATQRLDGRDGKLGRCLITQQWRMTLPCFPRVIAVPLPPCQAIVSITYLDADGAEQTLDPSAYRVAGLNGSDPATIRPAYGTSWPDHRHDVESVTVTFTAGYGDAPANVPSPLRSAILMHLAHLFEHREAVTMGAGYITETPLGYDDLIRDYRLWGF